MKESLGLTIMLFIGIALTIACFCMFFAKNTRYKLVCGGCALAYIIAAYLCPYFAGYADIDTYTNLNTYIPEVIGATVKQFVGESKTELVSGYMDNSAVYSWVFYLSLASGLMVSFSTVVGIFWRKVNNKRKCSKIMRKKVCDIILGKDEEALNYARGNADSTIIMLDDTETDDDEIMLVEAGYHVLKKKFDVALFKSREFRKNTRYNIIIPYMGDKFIEYFNGVIEYLKNKGDRHIYFYVETSARACEVLKDKIQSNDKKQNDINSEYLSFFSRDELIARRFVEENPLTLHMNSDFFEADTSLKADTNLNVFMLGFDDVSYEIYRQFAINNQFVKFKDGEYRTHNVNYEIYTTKPYENEWCISGLNEALNELEKNKDLYFPLPSVPVNVKLVPEDVFEMHQLKGICDRIKEMKSLNYFIINTGDPYKNIKISEDIKLLLSDKVCGYHIFLCNNGIALEDGENVTFFGDINEIFTHGVIVNEEFLGLAKSIDKYYTRQGNPNLSDDELNEVVDKSWKTMSYFLTNSNISLANNFRMKLNLLGLDYKEGTSEDVCKLLTERYQRGNDPTDICKYTTPSVRNALIAQEHARWNAYCMMSGYLPMKKSKIGDGVRVDSKDNEKEIKKKVYATRKNDDLKKHACITTHNGVGDVAKDIILKANKLIGKDTYKPVDCAFYQYDDMLLRADVVGEYLKSNGLEIVEK